MNGRITIHFDSGRSRSYRIDLAKYQSPPPNSPYITFTDTDGVSVTVNMAKIEALEIEPDEKVKK